MKELPVFIRVEEYKEMVDIINVIKGKLQEAKQTLDKLKEIKRQEDAEVDEWTANVDEIERKLGFIDSSLFEPEQI